MASAPTTLPPAHSGPPALVAPSRQRYIEEQLDRVRAQVKTVDLFGGLMTWAAALLGLLLVAAVVDAWLFDLTVWGRLAGLAAVLLCTGWYVAFHLTPLLVARVNPAFAARVIESGQPSLKNSLLNFWFLRNEPAAVHQVVYQAVEQQAASDLARAPVDTAVDHGRLIRIGVVLAGLLLAAGAYKVLSPKDPFRTLYRLAAPLARAPRPARVDIADVRPGDVEARHGDTLTVSARVRGLRSGETPRLVYSSADGQVASAAIELRPVGEGDRFEAPLPPPPAGKTSGGALAGRGVGLQQDLTYYLEAGDARSPVYAARVRPAPTLVVQSVEYAFPPYTGQEPRTVVGQGDIRAIEGTRVTVRAASNQPMRAAYLEFDPSPTPQRAAPATINMTLDDERRASASFPLKFNRERGPKSYAPRLLTPTDERNEQPILQQIEILADLPPEVDILLPQRDLIEVPEDGQQLVEVRALDPDFALTAIHLQFAKNGRDLRRETVLRDPAGRRGQVVASWRFEPAKLGLRAGDVAQYWAIAEDNRVTEVRPQPNSARTRAYDFKVTPARNPPAQPDKQPSGKQPPDQPQGDKQQGDKQQGDKQQGDKQQGDKQQGDKQQGDKQQGDKQQGDKQQGDKQQGDKQQGDKQQGDKQQGDKQQGDKPQDGQRPPDQPNQPGENQGASEQQGDAGDQQGTGPGQKNGNAPQNAQPNSQNQAGQPGEQAEDKPAPSNAQPSGQDQGPGPDQPDGQRNGPTGGQSSKNPGDRSPGQGDTNGEPGSRPQGEGQAIRRDEPLHDGEAIEKILEHRRQQEGPSGEGAAEGQGDAPSPKSAADPKPTEGQQPTDGQKPPAGQDPAGSKPTPGQQADPAKTPGDKPSGDKPLGDKPPGQGQQAGEGQQAGDGSQTPKSGDPAKQPDPSPPSDAARQADPAKTDPRSAGQNKMGDPGQGQGAEQPKAAPQAQGDNNDRPKTGADQQPMSKPAPEAQSPSISKNQSDSQSDSDGDRSGGGQQGGGQNANKRGQDTPGQNTPADEGRGAAEEKGAGEKSSQPGDKQPADKPTGNSGDQAGKGAQARPKTDPASDAARGVPPGGESGAQAPGDARPEGDPGDGDAQGAKSDGAGPVAGGGVAPLGDNASPPGRGAASADETPEDINLDYVRKATDLALEHLRDQADRPDRKLLDDLGWTPDDLKKHLDRWQSLKDAARADEAARRELDDWQRGLGLRSQRSTQRKVATASDGQTGLLEAEQTKPPPSYLEQFNAFKRGANR